MNDRIEPTHRWTPEQVLTWVSEKYLLPILTDHQDASLTEVREEWQDCTLSAYLFHLRRMVDREPWWEEYRELDTVEPPEEGVRTGQAMPSPTHLEPLT